MTRRHVVREGEGISSIAFEYGFAPATLEALPDNAALRDARQNLNTLLPGDEVVVPEKQAKWVGCAMGKQHRFRRVGVPEHLRVRFLDRSGAARAGLSYTIDVDGDVRTGTLDADGWLDEFIPPKAAVALLTLDGKVSEQYRFFLGWLPPLDTIAGVQARLRSLGLYRGTVDAGLDLATFDAIRRFQSLHDLPVSGELDEATLAALEAAFTGT